MTLTGGVFTSYDFGVTWQQQASFTTGRLEHVSDNGNFSEIIACEYPGSLWCSHDKGVSFSNATSPPGGPRYWSSAEASSDGRVWVATAQGEYIYVSTDYAETWTAQTNLGNQTRYGNSMGNWTDCNVSPVSTRGLVWSTGHTRSVRIHQGTPTG